MHPVAACFDLFFSVAQMAKASINEVYAYRLESLLGSNVTKLEILNYYVYQRYYLACSCQIFFVSKQ